MLRHRENAADLPQRAEFDASLPEHVASRKWSEEVRAAIRSYESEDAVCRSSPGACYQRICLLGVCRSGSGGDGWAWRVGSHDDLARTQRQARAGADDSVSGFGGIFL